MSEFYLKKKSLISINAWKKKINGFSTPYNKTEINLKKAIELISQELPHAIQNRAAEKNAKKIGVLFSGGIDSTIIAFLLKKMKVSFVCYAVGMHGAPDILSAKAVAKQLKFPLKLCLLSLSDVKALIQKTSRIIPKPDVTKVGVGAVVYAGMHLARKDNIKIVFSGLGSEEIFAGYERHAAAISKGYRAVHEECIKGLKSMYLRDIERDYAIAKNLNMQILTPFLDANLISKAISIAPQLKISPNQKKIILRLCAQKMGLPKGIAQRKKLAAQYGSRIDKAMEKIAHQQGFKYKKDLLSFLISSQKLH